MARYTDGLLGDAELGLVLDRYEELMPNIAPAAFNGLSKDSDCVDCNYVWKQTDRDALALAIQQSEEMRIAELGYFPYPMYVHERLDYRFPLILTRKHLVAVGSKVCTMIQAGVALVLGAELTPNDPVVINVATTVTVPSEIHVFYPGEDVEIRPSDVSISGFIATISIPRSRLVDPAKYTDCDPPLSYYENDNFLTTVDVKRCYTEPSNGAFFAWTDGCVSPFISTGLPTLSTFTDTLQQAFPKIIDNRLAFVELYPGTYSSGTWTPSSSYTVSRCPDYVTVNYLSGRTRSVMTEMNTARLAHTLLPYLIPERFELCAGCWKEDQITDKGAPITPYGSSRAAIKVWMADSRARIGHGGKFPSARR